MSLTKRTLGIAAALLLFAAGPAQAFTYFSPTPRNETVGLTHPTIQQAFMFDTGESFQQVSMTIDGAPVTPQADSTTGIVSYTPTSGLAAGVHKVHLEVKVHAAAAGWIYQPLVEDFTVTVATDAIDTLPVPDAAARKALDRVNLYRRLAGIAPVVLNGSLFASAQRHARYMDTNKEYAHEEVAGKPLFAGTEPWDRDTFFGYAGSTQSEDIHLISDPERAVDDWVSGPYHRHPILWPTNTDLGFGSSGTYSALEMGGSGTNSGAMVGVVWPYPGQTGVATTWMANEFPNPLRLYPNTTAPVGTAISLEFGGRVRALTLTTATLAPVGGVPLPVLKFSPENDDHIDGMVFIIPRQPLAPATTYTVHLGGMADFGAGPKPYERTWSFATKPAGTAMDQTDPLSAQPTPSTPAVRLSDIAGHWAEQQVKRLVASSVVSGYPDGTFRPNDHLTRAAFLKMLVVGSGLSTSRWTWENGGFTDVNRHWATVAGIIGAAAKAGIIRPGEYPNQAFHPDQEITREEIARMLVRARPSLVNAVPGDNRTFTDKSAWQYPAEVSAAINAGLITGYREDGGTYTFRPTALATRAEAAVMLVRFMEMPSG